MSTRFDRINDTPATPKKPRATRKKAVVEVAPPVDHRTVREKITDGVYDASKVMPWPGHKPRDPEVMAEKKRYHAIQEKLEIQFEADLLAEHHVTENPKAAMCFEKAWDHGHASGLHEVANYFVDFVGLIETAAPIPISQAEFYTLFAAMASMVEDVHAVEDQLTEEQRVLAKGLFDRMEREVNRQEREKSR